MINLNGLHSLHSFLGAPANKVNPLVLRLALRAREPWLKGCVNLEDLPRFERDHQDFYHVALERPGVDAVVERMAWNIESQYEPWSLDETGFWFASLTEAVFFKLNWC